MKRERDPRLQFKGLTIMMIGPCDWLIHEGFVGEVSELLSLSITRYVTKNQVLRYYTISNEEKHDSP